MPLGEKNIIELSNAILCLIDNFFLYLFQGGEDWKRKLVQPPNHFDGSFVDADLQRFRPEPIPSPNEDPWYASRLVDKRTSGLANT